MAKKNNYTAVLIFGFVIIVLILLVSRLNRKSTGLDVFAACLKEKGATFYGAFWCPHCQNQKKLFGGSTKNLPYVECSTPDGQNQTPICNDKKIQSYPTWYFASGTPETGELSLEHLAERTGCVLSK